MRTTMRALAGATTALLLWLAAGLATAAPRSPLDSFPAHIRYVSNDAPFVVFDVSPRSMTGPPDAVDSITLSFVAVDALKQVYVFPYTTSAREGATRMAAAVTCAAPTAGPWECTIPARELLARLDQGEGHFGLRIEAQGLDNDRSTVVITLPVKLETAKRRAPPKRNTAPVPSSTPRTLTLITAPVQ